MKRLTLLSLLVVALFTSSQVNAQLFNNDEHKHYESLDLQQAIKYYRKLSEKEPDNGEALFNLANSYRLNGEFKKAERWFEKAVRYVDTPLASLYYAQMLLSNGRYEKAGEWFRKYAVVAETSSDSKSANLLAEYCEELDENGLPEDKFAIQKTNFNSEKLDFSPMFWGSENRIIFASSRDPEGKKSLIDNWTNDKFVDLYMVEKDSLGTWKEPQILSEEVNSKYHEGSMTFNPEGWLMYFTRNDYNKSRGYDRDRNTRLHIYMATQDSVIDEEGNGSTEWNSVQPLWFNSNEFSTAHPTLSKDETMMVFASDQPGGFGHMDLYITRWEGGEWGKPQNLGDVLNTSGNEVFPYIQPETNDLYFSSNLHVGLGGLDIFYAKWDANNKTWLKPINVGPPLNGPRDDFGIITNKDFTKGYFTSNRTTKTQDDIYSFEIKSGISITGVVVDCETREKIEAADVQLFVGGKDGLEQEKTVSAFNGTFNFDADFNQDYFVKATKEGYSICEGCDGTRTIKKDELTGKTVIEVELPICVGDEDECQLYMTGTVINMRYKNPLPNVTVKMFNQCTGELSEVETGKDGKYRFPVDEDCGYVLMGTKKNFRDGTISFTTEGKSCDDPDIDTEILLDFDNTIDDLLTSSMLIYEGQVIELEHIYFDLDKYYIRADAVQDLEAVYKLMIKYPKMTGEIGAHTDSRATFKYNETLSDNRAKSAVEWLVKRGIDRSRLTWKGYGEYRLKNHCADDVPCSEYEHQRNRRVEFTVTSLDGKKLDSKERPDYRRKESGDK